MEIWTVVRVPANGDDGVIWRVYADVVDPKQCAEEFIHNWEADGGRVGAFKIVRFIPEEQS